MRRLARPLARGGAIAILNYMVHYQSQPVDQAFTALSDATRRGVLEQLGRRDASITELAQRYGVSVSHFRRLCRQALGSAAKPALRGWRTGRMRSMRRTRSSLWVMVGSGG